MAHTITSCLPEMVATFSRTMPLPDGVVTIIPTTGGR